MYDVAIIGAGPAGISALMYSVARGQKCIIFESGEVGGLIRRVSKVSHYVGLIPDETGESFTARLKQQLRETGSELVREPVIEIIQAAAGFVVKGLTDSHIAKTVIFAQGSTPKPLDIRDEEKLGVRLRHGDPKDLKDREVFVAGGSDGAAKEALAIAEVARRVHLVQIADKLLAIHEFRKQIAAKENIEVHLGSEIVGLDGGQDCITKVSLSTPEGLKTFETDPYDPYYVYSYIGQTPNAGLLHNFRGVEFDEQGYVVAPENGKLPVPGLYVAGDLRAKPVRQLATAVADGCLAAIAAFEDQR